MARVYAQLFTLVFVVVAIGGVILGDAGHIDSAGNAGGNLGGITLHLSWVRDALDLVILALLAYAGWRASELNSRLIAGGVGIVLTALAIAGFVTGDDAGATKGFAGLHFPLAVNVFDLIAGLLGVLSALGTVTEGDPEG
jgi:hypothetical protein